MSHHFAILDRNPLNTLGITQTCYLIFTHICTRYRAFPAHSISYPLKSVPGNCIEFMITRQRETNFVLPNITSLPIPEIIPMSVGKLTTGRTYIDQNSRHNMCMYLSSPSCWHHPCFHIQLSINELKPGTNETCEVGRSFV